MDPLAPAERPARGGGRAAHLAAAALLAAALAIALWSHPPGWGLAGWAILGCTILALCVLAGALHRGERGWEALQRSLLRTHAALGGVINQADRSARAMLGVAEALARSNEALARRSGEQAARLERAAAGVQALSTTVMQNEQSCPARRAGGALSHR